MNTFKICPAVTFDLGIYDVVITSLGKPVIMNTHSKFHDSVTTEHYITFNVHFLSPLTSV